MFLAIRMALYGLFAALAGQGLEFIAFDEATGQVDITFNIESLTTIAIGGVGFAGTFLASFTDRLRGPMQDESGTVSIRSLFAAVFGMILIGTVSACGPNGSLSPLGIASGLGCGLEINGKVAAGEYERGSLQWRTAVIACGLTVAQMEALEQASSDGN